MSEQRETYRVSGKHSSNQAPRASEHQAQAALITWAAVYEIQWPELKYLYAIPNGAMSSARHAIWFKAEGLRKGVPDLCLPVPRGGYFGLYIEMKTEAGKPSPEQMEWLEFLNGQGYLAALAYGFDQAVETLTHYLNLSKSTSV